MAAIVICFNAEPTQDFKTWGMYYGYYGPFEGSSHAKLWLETKHTKDGKCAHEKLEDHRIEVLANP